MRATAGVRHALLLILLLSSSASGATAVREGVTRGGTRNCRNNASKPLGDPTEADLLEKHKERCHQITDCFCIRHTVHEMNNKCGWCDSSQKALFGTSAGPDEGAPCAHWIFYSKSCRTLKCSEDLNFGWYVSVVLPILLSLGFAYFANVTSPAPPVPQKPKWTQLKRSKEEFIKGLWGSRARCVPGQFFQQYFETSLGLLTPLKGLWAKHSSSFARVMSLVAGFGVYSAFFNVSLKLAPIFVEKLTWNLIFNLLTEAQRLTTVLNMVVSFLFSFYVLGRVSWWWETMNVCRGIQGRNHDLAMLLSGVAAAQSPVGEKGWPEEKWNFYRYLMIVFALCFKSLSPCFDMVNFEDFQEMGLLESSERFILQQSIHPRKVVLKWLSMWIEHHVADDTVRSLMMDKLCGLRTAFATLHDQVEQRAPWSFEAILQTAVSIWMLTIPLSNATGISKRTEMVESWPMLPTITNMLSCAFYLSMLQLLEAFKDPFGLHTDAMDPEAILLETETSIVDYLTSPVPTCLDDICKDQLYSEALSAHPASSTEGPEMVEAKSESM